MAVLQALLDSMQEPSWENRLTNSNVARAANLIQ